MRIQPPKNKKRFEGKKVTESLALSFIGSHRIFGLDEEMTVKQYLEKETWITHSDIPRFITMFPEEFQGLAEFFLLKILEARITEQ